MAQTETTQTHEPETAAWWTALGPGLIVLALMAWGWKALYNRAIENPVTHLPAVLLSDAGEILIDATIFDSTFPLKKFPWGAKLESNAETREILVSEPGDALSRFGLLTGDRIVQINGRVPKGIEDLKSVDLKEIGLIRAPSKDKTILKISRK